MSSAAPARTIVTVPNLVLKRTAARLEAFGAWAWNLAHELECTMRSAHGMGLAAPQIGDLVRVFVVQTDEEKPVLYICNPEILREYGTQTAEEGCLSIPGKKVKVTRSYKIKVRYQTPAGLFKNVWAEGLLAQAFQHEIDHLNGVLITDYEVHQR